MSGKCASGADSGGRDGLVGYYRYTARDSVYYICDLSRLPGNFQFDGIKMVMQNTLQIDNQQTKGIDTFAVASHHENAHCEHFRDWWFQFNPNPISPGGGHMMASYDTDGDFIPNTEETARSLDPNNKYSLQQYNSQITVDDEEWLSMLAESGWTPGTVDHVDWAKARQAMALRNRKDGEMLSFILRLCCAATSILS